jgi:isoleucyl-tRNA synthetase
VHLCDYPSPDESLVEQELEDSMDLVARLVEAGRRARAEEGIKIRQPLKAVVVVCETEKMEEVRGLAAILQDELNVHEVQFADVGRKGEFSDAENYKQVDVNEETTLFLDVSLDKGLREEGLVRDLVRRVQGMRKDIDLEYTATGHEEGH